MPEILTLKDGRKLEYWVGGAKDGFPLVWLHGTPSGYIAIPGLEKAAEKKGLKLVTFSRSGYGDSTRRKGRSIIDEVDDVRELLKHLGIEKCAVGGWSGGGPHCLACAATLEGCVAVISVAAVAPYEAEGLDWLEGQGEDNVQEAKATLEGEEAIRKLCESQRPTFITATAEQVAEEMSSILPEVDKRAMLDDKELGKYMEESMKIALRHSVDGWIDDNLAFMKPWGFDVADVKCPVFLYQGSLDLMVPYGHGLWLGEHIAPKYLTKHLEDGEGHLSIFVGREESMLEELMPYIEKTK